MGLLDSLTTTKDTATGLVNDATNTVSSVSNTVSNVKDTASGIVNNATGAVSSVTSSVSSVSDAVSGISNISSVGDAVSNASNLISSGKDAISSVSGTISSVQNSIMNNVQVGTDAINSLKDAASSAMASAQGALDSLSSVKDELSSKVSGLTDKLSSVTDSLDSAKKAVNEIGGGKSKMTVATNTKSTDIKDSSVYEKLTLTKEEAMAYDPNGMKHFMNIWLETMSEEGIPYTTLGMRRWALTVEDEKVYGNAFLERQSSKTFKTLDSDGVKYWLSDYNSRHYYGEAADITGSLSAILETIAVNDNVLDVMHHYGICLQIETSESGHSKGTHFHGSTDKANPQTKWWGIVNQIRDKEKLKLYTVVPNSEYYEDETKNEVKIA